MLDPGGRASSVMCWQGAWAFILDIVRKEQAEWVLNSGLVHLWLAETSLPDHIIDQRLSRKASNSFVEGIRTL